MNTSAPNLNAVRTAAIRLPTLAALVLFFLGLSTNPHLDAAPQLQDSVLIRPYATGQNKPDFDLSSLPAADSQIRVLSTRDAALYRAAFGAQEKGDWKTADDALNQVKDKRLMGHILADRYLRRDTSLAEAQAWMASYAELPEAGDIYDKARKLKGFATVKISKPATLVSWTGNNGQTASSGFRRQSEGEAGLGGKNHIASKINAALRHGDPIKARELLTTEMQRGTLSVEAANDIISHIAATFFYEGQTERARDTAKTAAAAGVPLGLWIDGLSAWKQQDYQAASRSFASLAQSPGLPAWDRAAASYWAYRAAKHINDEPQARHWLAEAAKAPRSFYGYMAASQINASQTRSWKLPELNAKNTAVLAGRSAGWQALALAQIGKTELAESELRQINMNGARDIQTAVLALAENAHMPSLSLQLGGLATNDNGQPYEAAQYPLPPWQPTSGFKVDRALMYALMKHESHFEPDAVSQSGACGLMQIMPSTARQIDSGTHAGRGGDCPDALFEPANNMELGQKYVRVLAGQPMIGDNLMLLLAAYNGGPGNLAHWLDGEDRNDPLLFVETLPVRETRDYVQQVMVQYWMYRARLAEPETSVAQLAKGQWPRYALRDNGVKQAAVPKDIELASAAISR